MKRIKQKLLFLCITFTASPLANQLPYSTPINIPVSTGDLIDKITILQIKLENISDSTKLINIQKELQLLWTILHNLPFFALLDELTEQLKTVNSTLWHTENTIRKKEALKEFDTEFIQTARNIYINNSHRHALKQKINELTKSVIIEEKEYTKY